MFLGRFIADSYPGPPKPILDRVDLLELALRLGETTWATTILSELDEWADESGCSFMLNQDDEHHWQLWLYGSYRGVWHFAIYG